MAGRAPLIIGPFGGGLNLFDDPTAIRDAECVEALNWDPGLDGSLKVRPAFEDLGDPLPLATTGNPHFLGTYYADNGSFYLLASDGLSSTYSYFNGVWTLITSTFAASAAAQFDGKAWLVSPIAEADPGGYWTPAGGFVADAAMPHGDIIASYKFRLWVGNGKNAVQGTRVYYSKVLGQANFWTAPAFIDVGAGDGQSVVAFAQYYDALVVFRTRSIFTINYASDPAAATVAVLVPGVGLENKQCIVADENYLYFFYDNNAYQFINNQVQQINVKVPFDALVTAGTPQPFWVSVVNKRIVFSYYDTMFVYSLYTRTWTRWRTPTFGPIGKFLSPVSPSTTNASYALPSGAVPSGAPREIPLLYIEEDVFSTAETFDCVLRTKNFNYEVPGNYKRLFWWGVEAIFQGTVKGEAIPVVQSEVLTWGQLIANGTTWGDLLAGTWGGMLRNSNVETVREGRILGPNRKFVKFRKGLRFRQIGFQVTFTTDRTTPLYLFTLAAYVATKETVVKAVS